MFNYSILMNKDNFVTTNMALVQFILFNILEHFLQVVYPTLFLKVLYLSLFHDLWYIVFCISGYRYYKRLDYQPAWGHWLPNNTWKHLPFGSTSYFWTYWWAWGTAQIYELAKGFADWFWRLSNGYLLLMTFTVDIEIG